MKNFVQNLPYLLAGMNASNEEKAQNSTELSVNILEFTKDEVFYWILFNTILALYFIVSLAVYEYRNKTLKSVVFFRNGKLTTPGFNALPRIFCLASSVGTFFYWFNKLVIVKLLLSSQADLCKLEHVLTYFTAIIARILLISVLWCRQRSFYANELTKQLSGKCNQLLSILVGVVALIGNVGTFLIIVFAVKLQKLKGNCKYFRGFALEIIVFQCYRFFLIAVHVGLTVLFVMPLVNHTKKFGKNKQTGSGKKSNAHVKVLIVRSLAVSTLHLIMDFFPFFISFIGRNAIGFAIIAHTSLTIPFVLTIFIFTD